MAAEDEGSRGFILVFIGAFVRGKLAHGELEAFRGVTSSPIGKLVEVILKVRLVDERFIRGKAPGNEQGGCRKTGQKETAKRHGAGFSLWSEGDGLQLGIVNAPDAKGVEAVRLGAFRMAVEKVEIHVLLVALVKSPGGEGA